jgi:hypothetical protein
MMASKKQILLLPPMSANPRMAQLSESKLADAIHAVYRTILCANNKERMHTAESIHNTFGWIVSNTLNGNVEHGFIFKTSCIRAELVFLCVTYASTVCFHIHREFVGRYDQLTKEEIRKFNRRLLDAYFALRDVAKPQLRAWTTGPDVPDVAECSVHTINFLISLCAALVGMCFCKMTRLKFEKPAKGMWASITLFVAERFETCYSILQDRIWPVYGRSHQSAHELAVLLSGYALYYRTKSYAARLLDDEFIVRLSHRQIIALARCTEFLVAPLLTEQAGFDHDRALKCIEDMRRIIYEHMPLCEAPVIGMNAITTAKQCEEMLDMVEPLMPESWNVLDMIVTNTKGKPFFCLDKARGNYNVIEHVIRPTAALQSSSGAGSLATTMRKPRFELGQ